MQREIRFRYRIQHRPTGHIFTYIASIGEIERGLNVSYCGKPVVIGIDGDFDVVSRDEYAGLKDCKGVDIYEGDIVSFIDGHDGEYTSEEWRCGVVTWDEETASFQLTNRIEAESYECLADCEVIGNVHQHSHLLTVAKEKKEGK